MNDVHELVYTDGNFDTNGKMDRVGYHAFIVFPESSVNVIGEILLIDGNVFGKVIGFKEIHAPNPINIVIQVEKRKMGLEAQWESGILLTFVHRLIP
jgi:hypothetical protein